MVDVEMARNDCLKLPEVQEDDHFGNPAYRVKKKIFATLRLEEKRAVVKLLPTDQEFFSTEYSSAIYPVKGVWGKFGWTYLDLNKISEAVFVKALTSAWRNIAPKTLSKKYNLPG